VSALIYFRLPPWCSTPLLLWDVTQHLLVIHSHFVVSNSCASFHFHPPTLPPPPAHPPDVLLATSRSRKPEWFLYSLRTNHNLHSFLYNKVSTSSTCCLVFFLDCLTLEDATDRLSVMSVSKYQHRLHNIPEGQRLQ